MTIRKDIDDMLNNLMSTPEPAKKAAPAPKKPVVKKNKYDDMSVDDLLSALTGEKKAPAPAAESKSAPVTAPAAKEATVFEEALVVNQASAETSAQGTMFEEEMNIISSSLPEKAEDAPAAEPEPAPVPKKKKKIVISGELPDYEAIRQRELEKDRLAREAAEKAAAEAAERERAEREAAERAAAEAAERERAEREAAEKAAAEAVERERAEREAAEKAAAEAAERERAEREAAERAAAEAAAREQAEREAAEAAARELAELEAAQQASEELLSEEAPAEESISGRILSDIESAEEYGDEDDGSPSAEELVDAAIAALTEAAAEESASGRILSDIESDEEFGDEPAEESDTVSEMIENMREEAESAIAEMEAPAAEPEPVPDPEPVPAPVREEAPAGQADGIDVSVGQEKPKGKLTSALERVLGEDPDELVAERSEKVEEDDIDVEVKPGRGKFRKRLFAVLGVVFSVFAVIGMIAVISKGAAFFNRFTSGDDKKDGFTEAVYPAVIMDIEAFNSPSELSSDRILTAAIWSVIMDDEKLAKYEKTFDVVAIPEVEVEKYAVELFGSDIPQLEHCTVGPPSSPFYYDSSKKVYNVPVRPMFYSYSPDIKSVSKSGSEYTVTVDYREERPSWMESSTSKTVEFRLTENSDGSYRINSMKILSANTL